MKKQRVILLSLLMFTLFLNIDSITASKNGTTKTTLSYDEMIEKVKSFGMNTPSKKTTAPDFTVTDLNGKKVSIKDFRGKVVLLNFWATWCPPCRKEMPSMEKLNKAMKGKNFVILAISDEKQSKVKSFLKSKGYTFLIFTGNAGSEYGVTGIPTNFIINKNGYILGGKVGSEDWATESAIKLFKSLAG